MIKPRFKNYRTTLIIKVIISIFQYFIFCKIGDDFHNVVSKQKSQVKVLQVFLKLIIEMTLRK